MKKSLLNYAAVILAVQMILTGCSSAEKLAMEMDSAMEEPMMMQTTASEAGMMNGASVKFDSMYMTDGASQANVSADIQNDLSHRKIIKTANLSFETELYDEFMPAVEKCIASMGGYIESSDSYGGGISSSRWRNSYLTARIPESNYSRFMTEICSIGTLTHKSESSDDVTLSYVDTESRLKSLKTEYDALIEILDKAASLDDVIQLQARISEVTYQMESYQSQLRKYDDLIAYCTVRIDVNEVRKITYDEETLSFSQRVSTGLKETFEDIGTDLTDFSVNFIVSLPYIVIWSVIIVAVVLIISASVKKVRKKKEQKLIEQYLNRENEKENSDNR